MHRAPFIQHKSHSMQHLLRLKASEFKKYEIDKYLYLVRV